MRTESSTPGMFGWYPAAAAVAFVSLVAGSLWWETRGDRAALVSFAPVAAPAKAVKAAPGPPKALPPQVVALVSFAGEDAPAHAPQAQQFAAKGMRLLAEAIAARGDSLLWRDRAKRLVEAADRVETAADPAAAAGVADAALGLAAEWIADLRVAAPDAGAADPLAAAAQALSGDELLRNQADRIDSFFDAAAKALQGSSTSA